MKDLRFRYPLNLQLFADGGGEGGAGEGSGGEGSGEGTGTGEGNSGGDKTLTEAEAQARIDTAVKERLAREKKKSDASIQKLQKQLDELSGKNSEGDGAAGGEGDTAGNEALLKAQSILAQANQKVLDATATTEAVKLGVDPKYVPDVVRLADLSKALDEDGNVDTKAISAALDEVLKRVPLFKAATEGEGGTGFRVGGEGRQSQSTSGWGSKGKPQNQAPESKRWNRWN